MSRLSVRMTVLLACVMMSLPVRLSWGAAACPPVPTHAIAIVASSELGRADLVADVVTTAIHTWQTAGLVPVAGPSSVPTLTACVPVVTFTVFTDMPEAVMLYVTRYSERVTGAARVTMPDGRLWQGSQTAAAFWYAGYAPVPFSVGGFYLSGIPITTPQGVAEQRATQTAAASVARDIATMLRDVQTPSSSLSATADIVAGRDRDPLAAPASRRSERAAVRRGYGD